VTLTQCVEIFQRNLKIPEPLIQVRRSRFLWHAARISDSHDLSRALETSICGLPRTPTPHLATNSGSRHSATQPQTELSVATRPRLRTVEASRSWNGRTPVREHARDDDGDDVGNDIQIAHSATLWVERRERACVTTDDVTVVCVPGCAVAWRHSTLLSVYGAVVVISLSDPCSTLSCREPMPPGVQTVSTTTTFICDLLNLWCGCMIYNYTLIMPWPHAPIFSHEVFSLSAKSRTRKSVRVATALYNVHLWPLLCEGHGVGRLVVRAAAAAAGAASTAAAVAGSRVVRQTTQNCGVTGAHRQTSAGRVPRRCIGGQAGAGSSGWRRRAASLRIARQPVRSSTVAHHPDKLVTELLAAGTKSCKSSTSEI